MLDDQLIRSVKTIKKFIDNSFHLSMDKNKITSSQLVFPLLNASSHNTYIETISNKSDILYRHAKDMYMSALTQAYLDFIKMISRRFELKNKNVILAFDYTDENFYGDIQGFDIHGWTGEHSITGKFKFLTCSIVSTDLPQKIPLISLPIKVGHYKSSVILDCLSKIKDVVGKIDLILFDRGFYDKDLMFELNKSEYPYLIFVPKHQDKKSILYPMEVGEEVAIYNDFKVNKDKSNYIGENILIFLKQIYDKKSDKNYDWVFATNIEKILLENLVVVYKKRWRIETMFRVQDEACIKYKSKDMKIRYFLFLFEQVLQTIWISFYKDDLSFKEFLIKVTEQAGLYTKVLKK